MTATPARLRRLAQLARTNEYAYRPDRDDTAAALDEYADLLERPSHEPREPLTERLTRNGAVQHTPPPPRECAWAHDEDGLWQTNCGETFVLEHDGPAENGMHFCCYCGGRMAGTTQTK